MRGLGGFVLLAGIGVGLFVYFPAPVDRDTSLEQAQRVMATRIAASTTVAPSTTQSHRRQEHSITRGQLRSDEATPRPATQTRVAATPAAAPHP